MENLKRKYSTSALAQAGAFVRLMEIKDEMKYLEAFIHHAETAASANHHRPRKVKPKRRSVDLAAARKFEAAEKRAEAEVGNGFAMTVPRKTARRAYGPLAGVTLIAASAKVVERHRGVEMRPVDVATILQNEGWAFPGDSPLHAVQTALRKTNLKRRKDGAGRSAAVYYRVE